jgi:ribosomal protein S18 acetylase RimI-like enzyme
VQTLENLIRRAIVKDISILNKIDETAHGSSERRKFIECAVKDDRAWVVEISGRVGGYGVVSHGFFGRSFIDLIYIAESLRSSGYGPKLISFLEGESQSNDLFTSTNESNLHMQHVLEKLGYERSGVIHNLDQDDPEIVYVKRRVR